MSGLDLNVFGKIEAIYRSLIVSATDVVTIPDKEEGIDLGEIYFYCEDDGPRIMHERIVCDEADINDFYQKHNSLSNNFYTIQERANVKNRAATSSAINEMIDNVRTLFDFIKEHQEKSKNPFLFYPATVGINLGLRLGYIQPLKFNESGDYFGGIEELDHLKILVDHFRIEESELQCSEIISTATDSGVDHNDGSYRGEIALVKMLFKEHFNYDIES